MDIANSFLGTALVVDDDRAGHSCRSRHRPCETSEYFPELFYCCRVPASWSLLTNHARALLFIAHDPDARLRDLAAGLGVTERTAYGIVADLTEAGYVVKEKEGRRNRYQIQAHLPIPDSIGQEPIDPDSVRRERTIGEMLELLVDEPRLRDR
jgi:DNA-binding transcriptional ArsR family regulator